MNCGIVMGKSIREGFGYSDNLATHSWIRTISHVVRFCDWVDDSLGI